MNFAMRAIRRPSFGMASASRRENLATAWNVSSSSPREKRYRPSGRGRKLDSCGMTSKPCEGRSRSRMICGRRRLHTYEQTVNLNPGYTSSVTAAPPRTCRRSRTSTFLPAWARYAAVVRPLWPPPITMASYARATMPTSLKARRVGKTPRARRAARGNGGGVISVIRGPRRKGGGIRAKRFAVSFAHIGAVRQLGMARMGRVPGGVVVLPRPGEGVLRDSPFGGAARCLAALQVPHQRKGRAPAREQGRHTRRVEARERTDLLYAVVR